MYAIKRNIPNIITLLNLCCGLSSIIFAFYGNLIISSILILTGALFDFFDGLLARLLSTTSDLGKQLDSISDMVTFGVAPSLILFQLFYYSQTQMYFDSEYNTKVLFMSLFSFLYPICGAIRLANFNIDERQEKSFIGLPIPASAIVIASIAFMDSSLTTNLNFLILICLVLSLLLISKINLFSLKIKINKDISNKENIIRMILILISIILLFIFQLKAISFIVALYITLSIINNLIK